MVMNKKHNYYIDMDKFMEFVMNYNVKNSDTSISQVWSIDETNSNDELSMVSKDVSETKSNYSDTLYNIRYDFARQILTTITNIVPDENGIAKNIVNIEDMNFAQNLCFNSLVSQGIIKDMEDLQNE